MSNVCRMQSNKRRRLLLGAAAALAAAGCAYVWQTRRGTKRWQAWAALCNYIETLKHVSDVSVDLARGVKAYIEGTQDEVPACLVHTLSLLSSQPVIEAVSGAVKLAMPESNCSSYTEQLLDATFSERGENLLALIASVSTQRAVSVLCAYLRQQSSSSACQGADVADKMLAWLERPAAQQLLSRCLQSFVSAGIGKYCAETIHINSYDQLLEAASKPEHLRTLNTLTATACATGMRALVSGSDSDDIGSSAGSNVDGAIVQQGSAARSAHINGTRNSNGCSMHHDAHAERLACSNGHAKRCEHSSKQDHGLSWTAGIMAMCKSADVRSVCVAAAGAGSAGAVDAICVRMLGSGKVENVVQQRLRLALWASVLLWGMVLPLMLVWVLLQNATYSRQGSCLLM